MDIRRPNQHRGQQGSGRVIRLHAVRRVATGSIPMVDVVALAGDQAARSVIRMFGLTLLGRVVALFLVVLMVATPASPILAAEGDAQLTGDNEQPTMDEPATSELTADNKQLTAEAESEVEEVADENSQPASDESSESVEEEIETLDAGDATGTDTDVAPDEDEDADPGAADVVSEGESVFDPNRLPSADNPAPEGWYEQQGTGDSDEGGDAAEDSTLDPNLLSDDVIEPPTQEELYEQLRAEVYEEVLAELGEQISAFEADRQRLSEGCLQYEDGSFFCLNPEREDSAIAPQAGGTGTVYVQKALGEDDGEIYYLADGEEVAVRLTDDAVDDQFPAIDLAGRNVVWQSFVNDRWQIRFMDLASGTVEQLTSSLYNSMHPAVFGDMVVWQAWPGSGWEIFLARKVNGVWSVEQLTDNDIHDMFPKVAGGFVTWQTNEGGTWQVYAHDLVQGITTQLSTEAGKHENPRVALIWETEEDDGSRRIVSMNLTTGEVAPVGSRPATPDPDDLPSLPLADQEATMPVETQAPEEELPADDSDGTGNGDDL